MRFFDRWKKISISKKLYFVVGLMTILITGELLTLRFAMRQLSAARAFVGAESLWSKAQKNSVFSLLHFGITKNEKDYETFLLYLEVPEGDHRARLELLKPNPDLGLVRAAFLQGHVHPDDIEPIVFLIQRFSWISYLSKAIDTWTKGDVLLFRLKDTGELYRRAVLAGDQKRGQAVLDELKKINEELTTLEEDFSYVLGQGSRWLEHLVLAVLTLAVATVETIGLGLAIVVSRAITRGLKELNQAALRIGAGDFTHPLPITYEDEIGSLGNAVNAMGSMLKKSYSELENRVMERTSELTKMAAVNARLYEEAKQAVEVRDDLLSVASHELKTPLTSLYLQLQRLSLVALTAQPPSAETKKFEGMVGTSLNQAKRLTNLLDELLDLTRIRIGKFEINREPGDLAPIVQNVISQLAADAFQSGSVINLSAPEPVLGDFDYVRMGQVASNLLSNAIKYGRGKPIDVFVHKEGDKSMIRIKDNGIGISAVQQASIFGRFERGGADASIPGLGLGLYIVQQILKAHGGTITLESVPDHGTTFTVRL